MSQARIRAAFESHLAEWADTEGLPVVWQNVGTELPTVDHLRAFLLPAETTSRDLAGAMRSYRGVFQVSIFTRAGGGAGRAEQLAAMLAELFTVSLSMPSGGLNVLVIGPVSPKPAITDSDWYSVPVSCRYAAEEVLS
jgi:hypothetical protein